jgi:hypothetical protein
MAVTILAFPVQHTCPTCGRACSPEDLSECLRCGQQYCRHDSWECDCDRAAQELVQRATTSDGTSAFGAILRLLKFT